MKKICVVVGSRANYSSIKSALHAIENSPKLELQLVVTASALLERYGAVVNLIEADGFLPAARVNILLEGETPITMAKSTGLGLIELASVFDKLEPDVVLTVGDRFETMATTLAAAYMNIVIGHTMGGEVTGTLDESIRHAITKFSHIHFAASAEAKNRIIKLGELKENVHLVGCPRIDLVKEVLNSKYSLNAGEVFKHGVGPKFNLNEPFLLVSQHPVTTEYSESRGQMLETLEAAEKFGIPAFVFWPNSDAGSDGISKAIRYWRESGRGQNMHFFKNVSTELYIKLLDKCACIIGNSSSAIRDGEFIGTPAVNVGTRQRDREQGQNVRTVSCSKDEIVSAIRERVGHGKFRSQQIYGNGNAGKRIAEILSTASEVSVQKKITF